MDVLLKAHKLTSNSQQQENLCITLLWAIQLFNVGFVHAFSEHLYFMYGK